MTRAKFCVTAVLLAFVLWAPLPAAGLSHEAAGAPPAEVPQAIRDLVQADGVRVKNGDKVVAEYWARKGAFSGTPFPDSASASKPFPKAH